MTSRFIACLLLPCWICFASIAIGAEPVPEISTLLCLEKFRDGQYGQLPASWIDLDPLPPSRGWIIDGEGQLRFVHKLRTGLIAYDGPFRDGSSSSASADARVEAEFQKTADDDVTVGVAGRIVDNRNYYLARFRGDNRLELLKVVDGRETPLDVRPPSDGFAPRTPGLVTTTRYTTGSRWIIRLNMTGDRLEAHVLDDRNLLQAKVTARDTEFTRGRIGLACTPFVAIRIAAAVASDFTVVGPSTAEAERLREQLAGRVVYPIVRPSFSHAELTTTPEKIAEKYDVVVAGAGCGGWAAAVQAARLGAKVLLLEETDWIGGQMAAAAVTSMDEDGVRGTYAVRERGLYREFHESMTAYYHTLNKDPLVAYFAWPEQREGGYEPKVAQAMLYGFLERERKAGATLDVVLQTRVAAVRKEGNKIVGVKAAIGVDQPIDREVGCRVLIDATEYGDVIPLTGARYRVGNTLSDKIDPASLVQDHTWVAVLCEYPDGVPKKLQIKKPPPGYEDYAAKRWKNYKSEGAMLWGAAGKGIKGPRNWRVYFAWRGMADSESPLLGRMSAQRHTQCGFNGGNDYPVTAATIEDPEQRLIDEREGIYRSLGALYYFQHELGVPWSLVADEGYDTAYNRAKMKRLNLRADLEKLAVHLPQQPYVRECRRIIGVKTQTAADLGRYESAKRFPTSIALGDYFMDLDHGRTGHAIEPDLDGEATAAGKIPHGGGPFQVPLETLIPETIDGFIAAEKNISQSRLVNGATRLQPITMLTGQAAGTLAALAAKQNKQPRDVTPRDVQRELLAAGSTLIQRWYSDVPWRSELWQATQLLALYGVLDRPMQIDEDGGTPLGAEATWGVDKPLLRHEMYNALQRIAKLRGLPEPKLTGGEEQFLSTDIMRAELIAAGAQLPAGNKSEQETFAAAGEFAILAAQFLLQPPAPK